MPTEHYYIVNGNIDAAIKAARLAKETTKNDQMIHYHTYGVACDERCCDIEGFK